MNRPGLDGRTGQHIQLENIEFPENVRSFAQYLQENGLVRPLEGLADEQLAVRSDDVLEWIRTRNPKWAHFVEPEVAKAIREGHLFGFAARMRAKAESPLIRHSTHAHQVP